MVLVARLRVQVLEEEVPVVIAQLVVPEEVSVVLEVSAEMPEAKELEALETLAELIRPGRVRD